MHLTELYHKYEQLSLSSFLKTYIPEQQQHSGSFGIVLTTDENYVYKLWTEDQAYDDFIKLAISNQNLIFLPKILKLRNIKNIFLRNVYSPSHIKVAKIEKLLPIKQNQVSDWSEFNRLCRVLENYDDAEFSKLSDDSIFLEFVETAIFGWLKKQNLAHKIDFSHNGNIMLRGSTYVITDPWASTTRTVSIHAAIKDKDDIIFGKNGISIDKLPVTEQNAKLYKFQEVMSDDQFVELLQIVDLPTFIKTAKRKHQNLFYHLLKHCEHDILQKCIVSYGIYGIRDALLDIDIFIKFEDTCKQYAEVAQYAYDHLGDEFPGQECNSMFSIYFEHMKHGTMKKTTLSRLKIYRTFYKWILYNRENELSLIVS